MRTLTKRSEFLHASKQGRKFVTPVLVVQAVKRPDASPVVKEEIRVGFTATKTLGGAVVRNRVKRRLREAARRVVGEHGAPGSDYVFIGRAATAECPFDALCDQMKFALRSLAKGGTSSPRPRRK